MEEVDNKKLSYEELTKVANGLKEQNNFLMKQCQQMEGKLRELVEVLNLKRLDYLFKVVELRNMFGTEFVNQCITELEESLTIKEQSEEKEE